MFSKNLGNEGFRWFIGTVEDINDPLQLGRVKIRVFNLHGESTDISTDDLPWAIVSTQATSASFKGVGTSPTGIQIGSIAFGFFIDGRASQIPVVFATYYTMPGNDQTKNNVAALARGSNTIKKEILGPEPKSAYNSKYPFNKTYTTSSGHAVEIDDTPKAERIHIYHKSGTYFEINADGQSVFKSIGNNYSIIANNDTVYIKGSANIHIVGNTVLQVDGNLSANVGGTAALNIKGNATASAANWSIKGNCSWDGTITVSDDVIASGISLKNHTHSGVSEGSDSTGKPQ